MKFGTDKQIIHDLNIFSKFKGDNSVFDIFNSTITKGGKDMLELIIRTPLCDFDEINDRISTIKFLSDNNLDCELNKDFITFIEHYLNQNTPVLQDNILSAISKKISYTIKPSNYYYIIQRGLEYVRNHLIILQDFIDGIKNTDKPDFINLLSNELQSVKNDAELRLIMSSKASNFTFLEINHLDHLIRKSRSESIRRILELTYLLDAYLSVAKVARHKKFTLPEITNNSKPDFQIDGLFHPFIVDPISNDFNITENKNLCFVSGANMAGKSTFLKSIGLCVYLAHIGFPVPASKMKTSIFNGLYTTINISDDINKGYSHYYSEVRRVKDVALMIKEKRKVLVIFDELFRGTNVKDAYDATLMVSQGFSKIKDSIFFISTHIVEVTNELQKLETVCFKCFRANLENDKPLYNYKLVNGISAERHGLTILKNENVLELIEQCVDT